MEKFKHNRQVLSKGLEYTVLRTSKTDDNILKIPGTFNRLSFWPFNPVTVLNKELKDAQVLIEGKGVRIPRTKVHRTKYSCFSFIVPAYIMRQESIVGDGSVQNIKDYLENEGLLTLVEEYKHSPRKFVPKEGLVYWVDPTKGPAERVVERLDFEIKNWRKAKAICSKPVRVGYKLFLGW